MDEFEYDEFGNYQGPPMQDSDVESIDDNQQQFQPTTDSSAPHSQSHSLHTTTNTSAGQITTDSNRVFDDNVEIMVQLADTHTQFQPLMNPSLTSTIGSIIQTANKQQSKTGNDLSLDSGFGPFQSYHANFIHSERFRPPISTSNINFGYLIQDLLAEQWLQRNFTLIGGHLHGKTSLIDLFYTQTHPHINLQTITPKAPTRGTTPHNMKPTTANTGIYQPQQSELNPVRTSCWPLQYADAFYRERLIGHTTHPKSVTLPVSSASVLLDQNSNKILSSNPAQNKTYLFNILDTPAHSQYIDFTTNIIQRGSSSGVVLVVDCIEGVTQELTTQIEYAIREANPMVLILNKFDRFITELRCPPEAVYSKVIHLLEHINSSIYHFYNIYYNTYTSMNATKDPQDAAVCDQTMGHNKVQYPCPFFSPIENNVIFVSVLHCWAFTLKSFTLLHFTTQEVSKSRKIIQMELSQAASSSTKSTETKPSSIKSKLNTHTAQDFLKFMRLLWGDIYFDKKTKKFLTTQPAEKSERTFVEFVVYPIYKLYSACLTGDADYIHALLHSCQYTPIEEYILTKLHNTSDFNLDSKLLMELYTLQQISNLGKTQKLPQGTAFSPIIPQHIFSSSQDDLIREVIGKWLYYPFQRCDTTGYLKYIELLKQQDSFDTFSDFFHQTQSTPSSSSSKLPLHYQQSNATITASILTSTILDVLPPPVLRKSLLQQLSIFYQPPLVLGPRTIYPQHLGKLIANKSEKGPHSEHPPDLNHPHLYVSSIKLPQNRFIPPCKASLADILAVLPHPNGSTLDFLVRVHTLSINNDPSFNNQEFNTLQNSNTIAFALGDSLTLHRSKDKTYSRSHQITGIFSASSYRYRIPLKHCYDGNIVVLSFAPQVSSLTPAQENQTPSDLLLDGHGTFISNYALSLNPSYTTSSISTSFTKHTRNSAHMINLEQIDIKTLLPTFLPPITYPGSDVFQIAIEPTVASELPLLLTVINRTQSVFGNAVKIAKQPSGSYSISTRGEFLADEIIFYLRTITGNLLNANVSVQAQSKRLVPPNFNQLSFSISTPFYGFREGILEPSQMPSPSLSKGGYNLITTSCLPTTSWSNHEEWIQTSLNTITQLAPDGSSNRTLDSTRHRSDDLFQLNQYNNYLQWGARNELQLAHPRNNITPDVFLPGRDQSMVLTTSEQQTIADTDSSLLFGSNRLYSMYKIFNGWDKLGVNTTPWSFGLLLDANVQLLDNCTRGSHVTESIDDDLHLFSENLFKNDLDLDTLVSGQWSFDHVSSLVNGFNGISMEGPLTESPLQNTTVKLQTAKINKVPLFSTSRHLLPTIRKSISGSFLLAAPRLFEPMIIGEITLLQRDEVQLTKLLSSRRGQIMTSSPIPLTPYNSIKYKLPAIESMGFNVAVRLIGNKQTKISGYHSGYQMMTGDPLDATISLAHLQVSHISHLPRELFVKTRRRRGLPEFSLDQYFDPQMLDYLQSQDLSPDEELDDEAD